MRIRQLTWRRYRIPFVAPFRTAHGPTTHREGLILSLLSDDGSDDGLTGIGEAAPLVEFGGGDVDHTETLLRGLSPELIGRSIEEAESLLASSLTDRPDTSALRFAFDTALLDLQARARGVRLAELLSPDVQHSVPVNATIGQPDNGRAVRAAQQAVVDGFRTIKLKVGMAGSVSAEVERVAAVRYAIGPHVALRLDANGAWEPDLAIDVLGELARFDVEFVEQPVAPGDLDGMTRVRRSVHLPIAADESVTDTESARRIIDAGAADVVIIKPMVCGGLHTARRIIQMALDAGMRTAVTTSLESGVGVVATLHLAATLTSNALACGLATLGLLEDDLIVERLEITNGRMQVPDGPGLGVEVDDAALVRYELRGESDPS